MINEDGVEVEIANPETWTAEMLVAACRAVLDSSVAEKVMEVASDMSD